jgi:hypothetical protein
MYLYEFPFVLPPVQENTHHLFPLVFNLPLAIACHLPLLFQNSPNRLWFFIYKFFPCLSLHQVSSNVTSLEVRDLLDLIIFSPLKSIDHLEVLFASQRLISDVLHELKHRLIFHTIPNNLFQSFSIQVVLFLFRFYFQLDLYWGDEIEINLQLNWLNLLFTLVQGKHWWV